MVGERAASFTVQFEEEWKSGPDLFKMKADLVEMQKAFEFFLVPTHTGRAYISLSPTGPNFRDIVAFYFVRLIVYAWDRLGGPCPKCEKWFAIKGRRRNDRTFCSRRCAANIAKENERKRIYDDKIEEALQAMANYANRPARFKDLDWKDFVVRFLTLAVRKEDLTEPEGGSHARQHR